MNHKTVWITLWKDRASGEVSITAFDTKQDAIREAQARIKEHCTDYNCDINAKNGDDWLLDLKNGYLWDGTEDKEIDVINVPYYFNS